MGFDCRVVSCQLLPEHCMRYFPTCVDWRAKWCSELFSRSKNVLHTPYLSTNTRLATSLKALADSDRERTDWVHFLKRFLVASKATWQHYPTGPLESSTSGLTLLFSIPLPFVSQHGVLIESIFFHLLLFYVPLCLFHSICTLLLSFHRCISILPLHIAVFP